MKNNFIVALALIFSFSGIAYGAFSDPYLSRQVGTTPVSGYYLKTDGTNSTWAAVSASSGTISTSSPLTSGQPLYATGWNTIASVASSTFLSSIGGTPLGAFSGTYPISYNGAGVYSLSGMATTSLTATSPLSLSQAISVIGSSASALSLSTAGTWSGLAGSASVLSPGRTINGTAFDGSANIIITAASSTLLADTNTWTNTQGMSITGNSGTATVLQNARTINGTSFNGSANITITAASSTLLADANTFSNVGTTTFSGNQHVVGNLQVDGYFFAPVTIVSSGNATINGDLTVTGATTLATTLTGLLMGNAGKIYATATSSPISLNISGNAGTVTTNANLSGVVTSSGNTTSWGSATAGVLGTPATGIPTFMATSTLFGAGGIPNTALANSTISGIALGGNLSALTNDATLNGSSYNGSGAISDWGLNLANPNTWTGLQQFGNASTTQIGSTGSAYFATSGGNVGIGTTDPESKLHVLKGSAGTVTVNSNSILTLEHGGSWGGLFILAPDASGAQIVFGSPSDNVAGRINYYGPSMSTPDMMEFMTNSVSAMVINNQGNVGIGTTAPSNLLTVNSAGTATAQVRLPIGVGGAYIQTTAAGQAIFAGGVEYAGAWTARHTSAGMITVSGAGADVGLNFYYDTGLTAGNTYTPTERMRISTTGNVGIGTTNPGNLLQVAGGGAIGNYRSSDGGATNQWDFGRDNALTGDFVFAFNTASNVRFPQAGGAYIMNGNVGIGTTNPTFKLDVAGNIQLSGATPYIQFNDSGGGAVGGLIQSGVNNTGSAAGNFMLFQLAASKGFNFRAGSANYLTMDTTGNVGIGTTSPGTALDVNGTIRQATVKSCTLGLTTDANGGITGCVASDETLKTDITSPTYNALNIVNELQPIEYRWKNTANRDTLIHGGFLAQQVQSVFPSAVESAGQGLLGVDPNAINALLVKGMQEMQVKIDKLQAEVDQLKRPPK